MPAARNVTYNPSAGEVSLDMMYSHVFIKQLKRQNISNGLTYDPIGQTNILFVDDAVILGFRGGNYLAKTEHGVCSGTVEWRPGCVDPVYETVFNEAKEELALEKTQFKNQEAAIVGIGRDLLLGGTVTFLTAFELDMSLDQFYTHWLKANASDQAEHDFIHAIPMGKHMDLHAYRTNNQYDALVMRFAHNAISAEDIDPKDRTRVKFTGHNSILPTSLPALVSSLIYKFDLGTDYARHAVDDCMFGKMTIRDRLKNCYK